MHYDFIQSVTLYSLHSIQKQRQQLDQQHNDRLQPGNTIVSWLSPKVTTRKPLKAPSQTQTMKQPDDGRAPRKQISSHLKTKIYQQISKMGSQEPAAARGPDFQKMQLLYHGPHLIQLATIGQKTTPKQI